MSIYKRGVADGYKKGIKAAMEIVGDESEFWEGHIVCRTLNEVNEKLEKLCVRKGTKQ